MASWPSFQINGAGASQSQQRRLELRLDQINSAQVIQQARLIYLQHLSLAGSTPLPCGVILQGSAGRVVFELPVLLPREQFIPRDWLLGRTNGNPARIRLPKQAPPTPSQPAPCPMPPV